MVTLTIDDKSVQVDEGATVLEAARKLGIWVPTLCHHEGLGSYQACRLCTVEEVRNGQSRLQASCALPATEGMVIRTDSERVTRGRKVIMELILARVPHAPRIKELAARLGVTESPYPAKDDDCVLCGLCVRACADVMGVGAIGFSGRGIERLVETPLGQGPETCRACGACTFVCPTGKMQMEAEKVETFRKASGWDRQCRYQRMGFFSYKVCPRNFQCWRCEVDQMMEERFGTHPALLSRPGEAGDLVAVGEFSFAPLLHYHRGHTWVRILNGKVRVGLDDFAGRVLGPLADIDVPSPGRTFDQGEQALTLKSADKTVTLRFPVLGRVTDINPDLFDDPQLAARSPYQRGWIATVEPGNLRPDLTRLLHRQRARVWFHDEREKLFRFVSGGIEAVAADGGLLLENLPAQLTGGQWNDLVQTFFHH